MRGKDLFEKFTNIKEEYIQEVETESERIANSGKQSKGNKIVELRKWTALAACILGLLVIVPLSDRLITLNESANMNTTTTEGISTPEEGTLEENALEENAVEESVGEGEEADSEILEGVTAESLEESPSEFLAMYVDINTLPIYDVNVEMECMREDRTVILETFLENELESLVYDIFTNSESDEYLCTSTIHDISVLSEDEVEEVASEKAWDLDSYVEVGSLSQTAIVLVDVTWEETHGEIGGGTYEYIPEGRYEKYFILGQVEGSDIFEVWGMYLCE